MGMTILQAKRRLHEKWMELTKNGTDEEMMQSLSIADTVLGNYDESLKADMVAMLTEIQLEIEEMQSREDWCDYATDNCIDRCGVDAIIRLKINALKGEQNDESI